MKKKWLITEFLINNSQRNVCKAWFWMRREKENLSLFLKSYNKMVLGNSQNFEYCFRGRWKSFANFIEYLFFQKKKRMCNANSTLSSFISGLPPVYDVSGPSLWLNFHSSLIRVKGCHGCLKTVWLLSTEHLDHWQGSYMHAYQQYQKLDRRIFVI